MCCLVLAIESGSYSWLIEFEIESGLGLSLECDRVWIVIESGSYSWLSLADWAWFVILVIESGSWSCLIVSGSWRIVFTLSRICDVWSLTTSCSFVWVRRSVVYPRKTFTTLLVFEGDVLPVFCRGHYGDIAIFLLFICVTVLVWIGRCFVYVSRV